MGEVNRYLISRKGLVSFAAGFQDQEAIASLQQIFLTGGGKTFRPCRGGVVRGANAAGKEGKTVWGSAISRRTFDSIGCNNVRKGLPPFTPIGHGVARNLVEIEPCLPSLNNLLISPNATR